MKYLLILLFAACAKNPTPSNQDILWVPGLKAEKQETDYWCAAAASQMLMSQYGVFPKQCEIISKAANKNCCEHLDIICERTTTTVEAVSNMYGFGYRTLRIDFNTVVNKLKEGKPVAIYHLNGGLVGVGGHAVVAYGTFNDGGQDYIIIYDPLSGTNKIWNRNWVVGNFAWYRVVELIK